MDVKSNRLDRLFFRYQREFEQKALDVLRSGWYIMGPELAAFEREFASFIGVPHCVGVASGLDSLWMAFRLLGIGEGDEVIVQGNTFIAGVMGVTKSGAVPVLAEPDDRFMLTAREIERRITPKTKAVLVTHLYGMMTPMDEIVSLCQKYGLRLVEDCAQAHGAAFRGQKAGSFGDVGCFSFYPTKNMGAFGDGGAVVMKDAALAEAFRVYRNYGCTDKYHNSVVGTNSRLDELQAGFLRVRLRHIEEMGREKNETAAFYASHISNPFVTLPQAAPQTYNVWHQYVVQSPRRDALQAHLKQNGVETIIHYPVPPHLSEAYAGLGYQKGSLPQTEKLTDAVLSLPSYFGITQEEKQAVTDAVNTFTG